MSWHWFGPVGGPPARPGPAGAAAGGAPAGGGVVGGGVVGGGVAAAAAGGVPAPPVRPSIAAVRRGGGASPWKMRGLVTMAAAAGLASGTFTTSMRKRDVSGSPYAPSLQPGSSWSDRTADEPEM